MECVVDDDTEEYDESVGCLGRGGWDGRWAGWMYYYCGGDDKVIISAAAIWCGREGTLRQQPCSPHCAKRFPHRIFPSTPRPVSFEATEALCPSVHAHRFASRTPPRHDTRRISECFTL